MKLANYKHPTRQDFPQLPPWFIDAMKGPGKQLQDTTDLLQGKATLGDNTATEIRDLKVKNGGVYTVTMQKLKTTPTLGWVGYTSQFEKEAFVWRPTGDKQVEFTISWPSNPTGDITLRVIFMVG